VWLATGHTDTFADCFIIGKISARATNNCSKWVRIPVEGQLRKFKCVSQKLLGFSPHFVMSNGASIAVCSSLQCAPNAAENVYEESRRG
jgi:hypothetical protein